MDYQIFITVKEVRGHIPICEVGDKIFVEKFYRESKNSRDIRVHAFVAISTIMSAFLRGFSVIQLEIRSQENIGFLQRSDCGSPYIKGRNVIFKLERGLAK